MKNVKKVKKVSSFGYSFKGHRLPFNYEYTTPTVSHLAMPIPQVLIPFPLFSI
jgi:hypothetical protein